MLFLRKAAQDEALLDAVIESDKVSDEVIGFHCQQAAEKMLKALLSDLGAVFHKTGGVSKGIQPKTRVFDADKLRIVIVWAWLQTHGLFESQLEAFVLHFVHFQGRKIQRRNRLDIEHVFYLAILVTGNSAGELNSRPAVLKEKIFDRVLVR